MKQKANISVEVASNMTIGFDLGHGLDLEFSSSNIEFTLSKDKWSGATITNAKRLLTKSF